MRKVLSIMVFLLVSFTGVMAQVPPANAGTADLAQTQDEPNQPKDRVNLFIPNAFTPNGDGINDYFFISNTTFQTFEINVFDRWGNEIFTSIDPTFRWDGKASGKDTPSGTYVFVLVGTGSQGQAIKRSGTISLVR